jgi:hypothetical protein
MPATLQKPAPGQKLEPYQHYIVKCPRCEQRFVLMWDRQEWVCVKEWILVATHTVRESHPLHEADQLPLPSAV